jgi:hypothetical protein
MIPPSWPERGISRHLLSTSSCSMFLIFASTRSSSASGRVQKSGAVPKGTERQTRDRRPATRLKRIWLDDATGQLCERLRWAFERAQSVRRRETGCGGMHRVALQRGEDTAQHSSKGCRRRHSEPEEAWRPSRVLRSRRLAVWQPRNEAGRHVDEFMHRRFRRRWQTSGPGGSRCARARCAG